MQKAYLYPILPDSKVSAPNPYVEHFMTNMGKEFDFLNKNAPAYTGILDLFKYIMKIDYLFLNWIEDLPDKKAGWLQSFLFILCLPVIKARKIRIIWTMHNKQSHYTSNLFLKNYLFKLVLKKSDHIITHSKEGINYFLQLQPKNPVKIRYLPHPLEKKYLNIQQEKTIDVLIWGSLIPYKGIDRFLHYLHENKLENNFTVLMAGKVNPEEYSGTIQTYCNRHIRLDNRYIPEEELKKLISDSRFVLFTYEKDSVLSSGALMDTLSYGGTVIGPSTGAFKDLEEEELIMTYKNYDEIIQMINDNKFGENIKLGKLKAFVEKNNWMEFSDNISKWIFSSQ